MIAAEEIRYLILAAQREGNRQLSQALQPLGVSPSQAEVLRLLADFGQLSIKEVGEMLVCESGTNPSRLVDRLVRQGLVTRTFGTEDRRAVVLSLTGEGRETAVRIKKVEQSMYAMIEANFIGEDADTLIGSLRLLVKGQPSGAAIERRKRTDRPRS